MAITFARHVRIGHVFFVAYRDLHGGMHIGVRWKNVFFGLAVEIPWLYLRKTRRQRRQERKLKKQYGGSAAGSR